MGDALYELLQPYLSSSSTTHPHPSPNDPTTSKYLSRLSTLPRTSLTSTEPQSLRQSTHSNLLSLQSLAARSNAALVASSSHLSSLRTALPTLSSQSSHLRDSIPDLDTATLTFSEKYSRRSNSSTENTVLDRRKTALLLSRNADRLADIFELPTLLTSAIASASSSSSGAATAGGQNTTTTTTNYASALDLYSHIKRLHLLYPTSPLIGNIYAQSEVAMQGMTASLITSLRAPNIKLAAAMRTVGWLRRVAPDLLDDNEGATTTVNLSSTNIGGMNRGEGYLGALFLVCRLATLVSTLSALEPLRDLADQETEMRVRDANANKIAGAATTKKKDAWSSGQQTERYLKRYIEIFREQSFGIVGMFRSIFPAAAGTARQDDGPGAEELGAKLRGMVGLKGMQVEGGDEGRQGRKEDLLTPLPSALATFPMHLVGLLEETLRRYLPNVRDKASRESLLTQVLYCAGSLGRLGGDFSLMLADLSVGVQGDGGDEEDEDDDAEWVAVMKKHRVLAGKLEKMASGVATT